MISATGIAKDVEEKRHYRCVMLVCFRNEPGFTGMIHHLCKRSFARISNHS